MLIESFVDSGLKPQHSLTHSHNDGWIQNFEINWKSLAIAVE